VAGGVGKGDSMMDRWDAHGVDVNCQLTLVRWSRSVLGRCVSMGVYMFYSA
jgi:hypothetical protein